MIEATELCICLVYLVNSLLFQRNLQIFLVNRFAFQITFVQMLSMKKFLVASWMMIMLSFGLNEVKAQCSICSRTVQQLGEKPARALNTGILYLAAAPLLIAGFIGFKWWKSNREE
jgi:hypothetical protein